MTGLRAHFEEMAEDTRAYGDLDRAIAKVTQRRRRNSLLGVAVAATLVLVTGALAISRDEKAELRPLGPPATSPPTDQAVAALQEGPVTPGRYRFAVVNTCDSKEMGCPARPPKLPTLELTVPEGWDAATEFISLFPMPGRDTTSPNDAALALGWTNHWVGLYSEPCRGENPPPPDVPVGPSVEDFVEAVAAHPAGLDVTEPTPVKLGSHSGLFISLRGPADISRCSEWRPWDPAPYLQGPANIWDLWVMDVDGVRVVIMAEYFPGTPETIRAELHQMAESVRFVSSKP